MGMEEQLIDSQTLLNQLSLGCDMANRAVYLIGEINQMSAYRFISAFKTLDRDPGPITIHLLSEGGNVESGFAIYDTIRTANNPTMIEVMGMAASAAVPILLACTIRWLNPEAKIMIHEMSYEIDGTVGSTIVSALAKEADLVNKRYREIIAGRTGKSMKDVERWCKEETTFSAEEAIKLGFADKLVEVREFPKSFDDGLSEVKAAALRGGGVMVSEAKKRKKRGKAKK